MTNQMCQNLSWLRNQYVSNHLTTDSVALLLRSAQIIGQDLVDEADMPSELRAPWGYDPAITRRRRMRHHLRDRPAINTKTPCRLPLAQTLAQNSQPNPSV